MHSVWITISLVSAWGTTAGQILLTPWSPALCLLNSVTFFCPLLLFPTNVTFAQTLIASHFDPTTSHHSTLMGSPHWCWNDCLRAQTWLWHSPAYNPLWLPIAPQNCSKRPSWFHFPLPTSSSLLADATMYAVPVSHIVLPCPLHAPPIPIPNPQASNNAQILVSLTSCTSINFWDMQPSGG